MRLLLAVAFFVIAAPAVRADEPTWLVLDETQPKASQTVGAVTIRLAMEKRRVEGVRADVPVLTILEDGAKALTVVGEASGFDFPQGEAAILEMDPDVEGPEVAFTSFTGGAHCCTTVKVAERVGAGRWKAVFMGNWDGGGPGIIRDADGDGVSELVTVDNDFLYAFDCYACSEAPLTIRALQGGRVVDVSAEPRFLDTHRGWLDEIENRLVEAGGEASPGFWAGWIAAKARVGEGADAWSAFTRAYRPSPEDDVEECTVASTDGCPEGASRTVPFPDALKRFLTERGFRT
ncbi:hypothetical protein [Chthonobacter albigriseus]|uniref:hypothetical protein n=1 Tax=Chthonobacter albigriseus TaxID=1683161 RepID=UPI0015EECF6F|nr:hypothetical protein [Chthonobacter albigriseus]